MASKGLTLTGIAASLALAAVTLGVFSSRQLRGPEGTVHRFLMAVNERNLESINRLTFGTPREKGMTASLVAEVLQRGGRYEVIDVNQRSDRARVGVLFRFPNGTELPWIVSVRRSTGRQWMIDAEQSTRPGPAFLRN
jgi:hypothetical protein